MIALGKIGSSLALHSVCIQGQEEPPELQHAMQQLQAAANVTERPATDNAAAFEDEGDRPKGQSSAGLSQANGVHHAP